KSHTYYQLRQHRGCTKLGMRNSTLLDDGRDVVWFYGKNSGKGLRRLWPEIKLFACRTVQDRPWGGCDAAMTWNLVGNHLSVAPVHSADSPCESSASGCRFNIPDSPQRLAASDISFGTS